MLGYRTKGLTAIFGVVNSLSDESETFGRIGSRRGTRLFGRSQIPLD